VINTIQQKFTNTIAEIFEIAPEGISRLAVLGFAKSNFASTILLNPIAALLAKTIHNSINKNLVQLNGYPSCQIARKNPIIANGIANIVWLNLINERYCFIPIC
jgi:hypothetical protein